MRKRKNLWEHYIIELDFEIYKQTVLNLPNNQVRPYPNPWWTSKFAIERKLENGELEVVRFTWRQIAEMIIKDQIRYMDKYLPQLTQKERKSFIMNFFPFGEKKNTPYQGWIKARRQVFGE